jgi:5,10-methylenetetrahydromethanopterin reductase
VSRSTARAPARRPALHATIVLHNLVELEQFGNLGRGIPPALSPLVEQYRKIYEGYEPADARYLENHRGHLMFLRPEEHQVCTAELIRAVTITGTRSALRERLRELQGAGYTDFSIHIVTAIPACWRNGQR